jgi:T4 RnlA family RNA ligase
MNERDGSRPADFDWSKLVRIMDKRDGSMIHTVKVCERESPFWVESADGGQELSFTLKSKKSFESDVAVQARVWMASRPNFLSFCQQLVSLDATAIFEWTSPTARIVLPYAEEGLTLLHVRDNATGSYSSPTHLHELAKRFNIPIVSSSSVKPEQQGEFEHRIAMMLSAGADGKIDPAAVLKHVLALQETITDVEGWIFQFDDGQMVKVKTKWYMERHRAMTFLRERDIVGAVLNESLDDLKAMLAGEGVDISEINLIEERTMQEIRKLEASIDAVYSVAKTMANKKEAALKFGPAGEKFALFGLLMNKMDGKEPDVKAWYEKNVLPTISLRQLNLLQSVAEAE